MSAKLVLSERLYTALLALYPKEFRAVYGEHMRLTFRDACRAAYQRNGTDGLFALWTPTFLDLLKSALDERTRQGELFMSKTRLIALAGPLTLVVGALWLLSAVVDLVVQTVLPGEEAIGLVVLPIFLSFLPLLFALIGTRLRFHGAAGLTGKLGLALSVAGCAGLCVLLPTAILLGMIGIDVGELSGINYAALGCLLSIRIGYLLFGVDALRYKLLPRWNVMPLLLGLTVLLSLGMDWFGVPAILPTEWATPFLHVFVTGACWVLLGIALMEPRREAQTTAAM